MKSSVWGPTFFFWGQKQERTPTWYGMFLKSGEETAPVDVMHFLWTGGWPVNQSPIVHGAWLDGKKAEENVHLKQSRSYSARLEVTDPDKDELRYSWEIMEESSARSVGGDRESVPKGFPELIKNPAGAEIRLAAPDKPGPYRLFAYVFDGKGHAAHANIPFYVDAVKDSVRATERQFSQAPGDESR